MKQTDIKRIKFHHLITNNIQSRNEVAQVYHKNYTEKYGKRNGFTVCVLTISVFGGRGDTWVVGIAQCSRKDQYNRRTGRQEAFKLACIEAEKVLNETS